MGRLEKDWERSQELKSKFEGLEAKVCNIEEKYGRCPAALWEQLAKAQQDYQLAYALYKDDLREDN